MKHNNIFKKYHSRLVLEAVVKSALCGLTAGFLSNFIAAFVCWILSYENIWLSIGIGIGIALVFGVAIYFLKFRPTTKDIARRVDKLGLEERLITMMELENDDSYIAKRQREDALIQLGKASHKALKMSVPISRISMGVVASIAGISMTVVSGVVEPPFAGDAYPIEDMITVSYLVEDGGTIKGEEDQLLFKGENTSTVIAIPDEGWVFIEWDDGNTDPVRSDLNITEDRMFMAIFEQIDENEGEGEGDGEGEPGDEAGDQPGEGDGEGEPGESGENGGNGQGKPGGDGAGGKFEDKNQVIDGETFYRDVLDEYAEDAKNDSLDDDVPPELGDLSDKYFGSL